MFTKITVGSSRTPLSVVAVAGPPRTKASTARASGTKVHPSAPQGFRADVGETALRADGSLLLGLGAGQEVSASAVRSAGARLVRSLERLEATSVSIAIDAHAGTIGLDGETFGRALGEGMAIGNWRFDDFDGTATTRSPRLPRLTIAAEASIQKAIADGLRLGDAVNDARRLGATPPNVCNPTWIAQEAKRLAKATGMSCRVIGLAEAKRLGMGGLVAVGQASASPPCLVILEHRPKRVAAAARGQRLVFVGKTITYDTGGYSLKINNGMKGMKYDKCGGTAAFGAMRAIAEAKLPIHVTAILAVAENMVSGEAYRPDDIITLANGITVEVTNTDAEGRLVLADALVHACKAVKPTALVDIATLTGGVVVALGAFCAGYFCNDDGLRDRLESASERTGEKLWRLPLWREHKEFMRSQHADILNSNAKREAHPIQGAAFLAHFVEEGVPWAHIDIAGMASSDSGGDLAAGPTGYGVRLLHDLAAAMANGTD